MTMISKLIETIKTKQITTQELFETLLEQTAVQELAEEMANVHRELCDCDYEATDEDLYAAAAFVIAGMRLGKIRMVQTN